MSHTLTTDHLAANVHATWQACPVSTVDEGRAWYPMAHHLAVSLASGRVHTGDVLRSAGTFAALSPRQAWARNVDLAHLAYNLAGAHVHGPSGAAEAILTGLPTLGLQRRQVVALLVDGADPDTVVKGVKTNDFMHVIADPTDPYRVVIDRHALAIAYGARVDSSALGITDKRYRQVADAYRQVADAVGELPSTVQAATWVHWRTTDAAHTQARAAARMDAR